MITLLNGSPNKKSKTMTITKKLISNYKNVIHHFDAYQMNVFSCDDCQYCKSVAGCKFKDDMVNFYDCLKQSDTLIISSPIYFGTLSDQTLQIINRLQVYYNQKYHQNNTLTTLKNIILVVSQGSDKNYMHEGVKHTLEILGHLLEAKTHFIAGMDTDHPINFNKQLINQITDVKSACFD
ncbi:MAG: flavodoxin family protein [Candidatus Izimaplasma sp.]|nr:flavodoxin family protein [Candidatus Izimaplasma bacterium]